MNNYEMIDYLNKIVQDLDKGEIIKTSLRYVNFILDKSVYSEFAIWFDDYDIYIQVTNKNILKEG